MLIKLNMISKIVIPVILNKTIKIHLIMLMLCTYMQILMLHFNQLFNTCNHISHQAPILNFNMY